MRFQRDNFNGAMMILHCYSLYAVVVSCGVEGGFYHGLIGLSSLNGLNCPDGLTISTIWTT